MSTLRERMYGKLYRLRTGYTTGEHWKAGVLNRYRIACEIGPLIGMTPKAARKIVRVVLDVVIQALRRNETVVIAGLGKFYTRHFTLGPQWIGKPLHISKVYFKPCKELKAAVNDNQESRSDTP